MQCDIGVIGNGVIGKATALGFAQAGYRVILLCPSDSSAAVTKIKPEWDVRVYALNHTAKNLLTQLKVWDALDLQRVTPIEAMNVVDRVGSGVGSHGQLVLDAYTAHQNELAYIVEDQNLNHALDSALRFTPNITIVTGKAQSMSPDISPEFAELRLENQTRISAQLWIGADGAHSWLRNQAAIGWDYRSYEQRGVVANFSCAKPHHGVAYQWFLGEEGVIALLPLAGQHVSLVWSAPDALAATLCAEDAHQLAHRLLPYCAEPLGELLPLAPYHIRSFPLQFIRPHSMIAPKIALVGDAAHVVHPLAGHGLNLGFGDVVALLEAVAQRESWRSCGDMRVLQRYARARKEQVLLMQLATDGLARLFGTSQPTVQTVRNLGMNVVNKISFLKKQLMQHAMGI